MAHTTITDSQNDGFFSIDPITRVISPSGKKTKVMQYDHNSERFFFQMTTPIEGHPMEECNKVEVHYINGATAGVYEVTDLIHQKTSATTEQVVFSWILSQNVTKNAGALSFLIRFSCVAEDGTIEYAWNTEPCTAMSVAKGMYNSEAIIEQYADVLEQWKASIFDISSEGVGHINAAVAKAEKAVEDIEEAMKDVPEDYAAMNKDIAEIKNTLKTGVAPNFYAVKNGGELTSAAQNRKDTTTVELLVKVERDTTGWFYGNSSYLLGAYYATTGELRLSLNVGDYKFAKIPYVKGDIAHIVMVYDHNEKSKTAYFNGVMVGNGANTSYSTMQFVDRMLDGVVVYQKRIWGRALNADEVEKLYNHGFPTKYKIPENLASGLISNLSHENISEVGWYDTATGNEIAFAEGVELYSVDELNEYEKIKTIDEEVKKHLEHDQSVIKQSVYVDFKSNIVSKRGNHEMTFIGDDLVSFNKPSDGYAYYINTETWTAEKSKFINFTDLDYMGTPRELEMKSCDYKYGKLIVGNGRAIKYDETDYTQQVAKLYVFHNADTWKNSEATEINNNNCGNYDVIDISGLGYKTYGWWGNYEDCVFVSCNLFNDVYLIQLGRGTTNFGQGTYVESAENRYNGSYCIINHWHQNGALGEASAHGGQYYKGHLYIATNDTELCTVYKCILNNNGTMEFDALNFVKYDIPNDKIKFRYIDGMCIKDDVIYTQPLIVNNSYEIKNRILTAEI